ncbi:MAG: nuclear transport factor 2 family protein [Acidobacteria bacterium]|nr:nuclear transport factor 2 family protein [Acidobacteriota bacterium]
MPTLVEDRDEILQLMYRYNHAVDGQAAEEWASTFTDDAIFDAAGRVATGRDELVGFASALPAGMRHIVANPVIDVQGDTAHVRAYITVLKAGAIMSVGTYDDQLVRTPAGWRFAKRVFTPDAPPA